MAPAFLRTGTVILYYKGHASGKGTPVLSVYDINLPRCTGRHSYICFFFCRTVYRNKTKKYSGTVDAVFCHIPYLNWHEIFYFFHRSYYVFHLICSLCLLMYVSAKITIETFCLFFMNQNFKDGYYEWVSRFSKGCGTSWNLNSGNSPGLPVAQILHLFVIS